MNIWRYLPRGSLVLEREQAVCVLQEVLRNFSGKWIDSFNIRFDLNRENEFSIEINGNLNESTKKKVNEIAEVFGLCVKDEGHITVFTPIS